MKWVGKTMNRVAPGSREWGRGSSAQLDVGENEEELKPPFQTRKGACISLDTSCLVEG